jgi:8-oxo-dGTP pyrophosphatase MutT (NUDIX family)
VGEVFRGRLVSVEAREGRYREIIHHPGSCAVVALVGGEILLVRQFREAVDREMLEIPAGTRDVQGEDPAECAARELVEETGHRAIRIEPLASVHASPGFLDERIELFLAEAEPAGEPSEDGIEIVRMPLSAAAEAVADGAITDAKSAVGILLAAGRGG